MREILFKAKRTDNGEWVEGDLSYIVQRKERMYVFPADGLDSADRYEVDPETLCLYIGLKDKNGRRIWENDIVLLREEIQNYEWKAKVEFGNPNWEYNWGWQLVPIGECDMNKDILLWIDMEFANCEVIGNIFEHQELLGQDGG